MLTLPSSVRVYLAAEPVDLLPPVQLTAGAGPGTLGPVPRRSAIQNLIDRFAADLTAAIESAAGQMVASVMNATGRMADVRRLGVQSVKRGRQHVPPFHALRATFRASSRARSRPSAHPHPR